MKKKKQRFDKTSEKRTEFVASSYLNKMLAQDEFNLKKQLDSEKIESSRGKPKALFKREEWYKRMPNKGTIKKQLE